jgi:hypothetical protein
VRTEPDSGGYRDFDRISSISLDLFLGREMRPFPVNSIYWFLGSDFRIVLFQVFFSAISWAYLAYTVCRRLLHPQHQKYVWIFLSILAFSPSLIYRDLVILPESLTLSVSIILFANIVKFRSASTKSQKLVISSSVLLLILAIQRPTFSILLLTLIFLFVFVGLVSKQIARIQESKVLITIVLIISISGLTFNVQNNKIGWPNTFSTSYPVYKDAFVPGLQMWEDHPNYLEWRNLYSRNGLPDCAKRYISFPGPFEYSVATFGECKEAHLWLKDRFWKAQALVVFQNPTLLLSSSGLFGALSFVPAPDLFALEKIGLYSFAKFPTFNLLGLSSLEGKNYLLSWNSFLFALFLLLFLVFINPNKKIQFKRISGSGKVVVFSLLINILFMGLIMPSDAYRHSIPLNYLLFFVLLVETLPLKENINLIKAPKNHRRNK